MSIKLLKNAAICGLCGEEVISTYRHDFQQCKCDNIYVDGGNDYQRVGWDPSKDNSNSKLWSNKHNKWIPLFEDIDAPLKDKCMEDNVTIDDWFNIYDQTHLNAFRTLTCLGCWPEGFIPKNITFTDNWDGKIIDKMAFAWLNHMTGNNK